MLDKYEVLFESLNEIKTDKDDHVYVNILEKIYENLQMDIKILQFETQKMVSKKLLNKFCDANDKIYVSNCGLLNDITLLFFSKLKENIRKYPETINLIYLSENIVKSIENIYKTYDDYVGTNVLECSEKLFVPPRENSSEENNKRENIQMKVEKQVKTI